MMIINPTISNLGWECPRCHSVYAPWVYACMPCNEPKASTGTSTSVVTVCSHDWSDTTVPYCLMCGVEKQHTVEWSWTTSGTTPSGFASVFEHLGDHVCANGDST